jgi:large repetitive protein
MAKVLSIRYTVVDGALPNGLALNPETGAITGSPDYSALNQGPVWQTASGSLGTYNENDAFTPVTFSTTTTHSPVVFSLSTSNDKLPWGLVLNPTTGTISGTVAPLKQRVKEAGVTFDGPTWNTQFGKLANFDEGQVSAINLSATPLGSRTIKAYSVVEGDLPFGLVLNLKTGVISGTVGRLKNPGPFVDVPKLPVPVWNQAAGNIATIHETESLTMSIGATPDSSRSMSKYIIREGNLPLGLKLNINTGAITGTAAFLPYKEAAYYDSTMDPVFSDTVTIGGSPSTVVDQGSLGSYSKGASVSIALSATPASGRTIKNYSITNGALPLGLKLNATTGVISGTILNSAFVALKTYNFTVAVVDKDGSFFLQNNKSRTYKIVVQ